LKFSKQRSEIFKLENKNIIKILMVDERLISYIRECLRRGFSENFVRETLLNQGWDINEINEAINIVTSYSSPSQTYSNPPLPPLKETTQSRTTSRPTGVTIICVLVFLISILMLITGVFSMFFSEIMKGFSFSGTIGNTAILATFNEAGLLFSLLGFMMIIFGVVGLIAFYLLLKMKKMGSIIVTIVGIVSIIQSLISFNINNVLGIVLWVIIIAYLWTKRNIFV